MHLGAESRRTEIELAGLLFGECDEGWQIGGGDILVYDQKHRLPDQHRDRNQVLFSRKRRWRGQALRDRNRSLRREQDRVAIGIGFGDRIHANVAAGSGAVLHDDALLQLLQ